MHCLQTVANTCTFANELPGMVMYASTGGSGATYTAAVNSWMAERPNYNPANPVFSEASGHYTCLVWKSASSMGCAEAQCGSIPELGGAKGTMIACSLNTCNMQGQFASNVCTA